jgi:hypothetical protein
MDSLPYTTDSLASGDLRLVPRHPGIAELERLFAAPASVGRGTIAVEGGVSLIAGPGMGKTTMLRQLAHVLGGQRQIATAFVRLPSVRAYRAPDGFYPYLGAVLAAVRVTLLALSRDGALPGEAHSVLQQLSAEIAAPERVTPPIFEHWMRELGTVASHGSGLCLLFDDVDDLYEAPWKQAFVSALRFTFQACPGITPVYGVWMLFRDESLAGSNYFRNVTRPVFLAPLSRSDPSDGPRGALMRYGLAGATAEDMQRVSSLVGGHPQLLHRLLGDVAASGWTSGRQLSVDALLDPSTLEDQRRFASSLLAASPGLTQALQQLAERLASERVPYRSLAKGLAASGLVDESPPGDVFIPQWIADCLARS